jgi:hypothetical protein
MSALQFREYPAFRIRLPDLPEKAAPPNVDAGELQERNLLPGIHGAVGVTQKLRSSSFNAAASLTGREHQCQTGGEAEVDLHRRQVVNLHKH